VEKTSIITKNVGVVYSGLAPDFRLLVKKGANDHASQCSVLGPVTLRCGTGRKKAQEYYKVYKEDIPVSQLVRELASIMQEFTQSG
jgi:20S proteasome subunit alpha 2